MELDVLPGGDVAEAARVARGHVGKRAHLRRGHDSLRRLDAHHLDAILTLAIRPAHEAEPPPHVGGHLAALELAQHLDELVDVVLAGEVQVRTPYRFWVIDCGHTSPHCSRLLRPGARQNRLPSLPPSRT